MSYGFDQFVSEKVCEFRENWTELLKWGVLLVQWCSSHVCLDRWNDIGRHLVIWLGNNCETFNYKGPPYVKIVPKVLRGYFFDLPGRPKFFFLCRFNYSKCLCLLTLKTSAIEDLVWQCQILHISSLRFGPSSSSSSSSSSVLCPLIKMTSRHYNVSLCIMYFIWTNKDDDELMMMLKVLGSVKNFSE